MLTLFESRSPLIMKRYFYEKIVKMPSDFILFMWKQATRNLHFLINILAIISSLLKLLNRRQIFLWKIEPFTSLTTINLYIQPFTTIYLLPILYLILNFIKRSQWSALKSYYSTAHARMHGHTFSPLIFMMDKILASPHHYSLPKQNL